MDTIHVAATALSLVINGLSVSAHYVQAAKDPCEMARSVADEWRRRGSAVIQSQTGPWCTAGMVKDGAWVAEQWRSITRTQPASGTSMSSHLRSEGWRLRIPLEEFTRRPERNFGNWNLEVTDRSIGSRIQFRHLSSSELASAALQGRTPMTLTSFGNGGLLVKGADPAGRGYAIAIERGVFQ